MLYFVCPKCGQNFETEDNFLGTKVQCCSCDARFYVPANGETAVLAPPKKTITFAEVQNVTSNEPPPPPPANDKIVISFDEPEVKQPSVTNSNFQSSERKLSPRQRRLYADQKMMYDHFSTFPYIRLVDAIGNPPEKYIVDYLVKGIERLDGDNIVYRNSHRVEIVLPSTYPRTPPTCRMLTPIFHPNIEPAVICIGDHWTAGERLCDLVVRIGEIITYQSYNIKSPLDGEAAMWADLHQDFLPIDKCDLMPPEL